ncbi:sulfatase [Niabella aurantiaca]|uniref:sulfatase n=1 Tax=Niabella aurantiaca TaxID=379900 RepID=UPI00037D8AB8|nr:sulfatase [Niabella aurantiaca]
MKTAACFKKWILLSMTVPAFFAVPQSLPAQKKAAPPNIVFILVDDLGWSDLGYMGSTIYETPHIDQFAAQGMHFTDFYAAGPVCSPTRASILTGRNPVNTGVTTVLISPDQDVDYMAHHLALSEYTLAEALRDRGYATGLFGKWHLGYQLEHWATHQGFDVAIGGEASYNAWQVAYPDRPLPVPAKHLGQYYFSPYYNVHMEDGPVGENLGDRLTDETIRFIESRKDRPFFAFLSFHAVHTPLDAKREVEAKFRKKINGLGLLEIDENQNGSRKYQNLPEYAAMVNQMDGNVGKLLKKLDDLGLSDNTIVVFSSDNGGKRSVTSNLPLRGGKHMLYEGGIRIPVIVRWPGNIQPRSISHTPLISDDFYPTLLDLAGLSPVTRRRPDGISFKNVLLGNLAGTNRGALYWHYPHGQFQGAVRREDYKLLYYYKTGKTELYDLKTDPGETKNLSKKEPERVAVMKKELHNWLLKNKARFPREGIIMP